MQVLVVVASKFFRQILQRHLAFLAQPAHYCGSLAEAGARLNAGDIDLICVEGTLPDGRGIDFARSLRVAPGNDKTPILLLSGNNDSRTVTEALTAGITEVFPKTDIEPLADYIAHQEAHELSADRLKGHAIIVEDSRAIACVFESMLNRLGLSTESYARAEEALTVISRRHIDLVVTDVQLEGNMTGLGLVRTIRQLKGRAARVPILAVSGLQDAARKIELLRHGANDFISKPVEEEEFSARVRNMVHLAQLLDEADAQREQLRRQAMTDQLTGLYNRYFLGDIASKRVPEAFRHGIPVSVLILDLDHFKQINDTHGHPVGDIVLAETGALLQRLCVSGEIAARTGGEEFVLVLINRDAGKARYFAETLRRELASLNPGGIRVTGSIGIGSIERGAQSDFASLAKAADDALYMAKAAGRNTVALKLLNS
jgi:two-component system cell cycle response regulator